MLRGFIVSTVVTVALSAVGAYVGLLWLAFAMIVATGIQTIYLFILTRTMVAFEWHDLWTALWPSALVAIGSSIGPLAVVLLLGARPESIWLPIAVGIPTSGLGFIFTIIAVKHPLSGEIQKIKEQIWH